MRYHYSHVQAEPLVKDLWAGDTLVAGQGLRWATGANRALVQDVAQVPIDVVGVTMEAATASTLSTGTIVNVKAIVNPDAVFLAQCDLTAANDIDVSSATTLAITVDTSDDDLDGSWVYVNTGTGAGQLGFIGAATTTVLTLDTTAAFVTAPASDSDIVIVRHKWSKAGGRDLDSTLTQLLTDEDETGAILVLENYIQSSTIPFEPLEPRKHHNLSGLNATGINIKFFSDIHFQDHVLLLNTI